MELHLMYIVYNSYLNLGGTYLKGELVKVPTFYLNFGSYTIYGVTFNKKTGT